MSINKVHYYVSGLQNTTSKTQIKNALDKLEGVQMVNVDLGRGSIEIGYNERTNESAIKNCIEHTGYEIQ